MVPIPYTKLNIKPFFVKVTIEREFTSSVSTYQFGGITPPTLLLSLSSLVLSVTVECIISSEFIIASDVFFITLINKISLTAKPVPILRPFF